MKTEKPKDNTVNNHKGGRPKKGVTRSEFLMVRMTATEKLLFAAKARKAGLMPSEWFRQAAKSAQVLPRLLPSDVNYLSMVTELANNLNQLTRLAHIKG